MQTIDITSTWGEWGNIYARLAASKEVKAIGAMRADLARALAAAQALQAIQGTLNDSQQAIVSSTIAAELTKQGY